jgi:hypothetical protein
MTHCAPRKYGWAQPFPRTWRRPMRRCDRSGVPPFCSDAPARDRSSLPASVSFERQRPLCQAGFAVARRQR